MPTTVRPKDPEPFFKFGKNTDINTLLERNKEWSAETQKKYPDLFKVNGSGQWPRIFWIGCSDSRAGEACLDLLPGEAFVHRNIANLLPYNDFASLSALQFSVEVLKVEYILVCGHTNCGGCQNALSKKSLGLMDNWLKNLRDVKSRHRDEIESVAGLPEKVNKLAELNVVQQVHNVRRHRIVKDVLKVRDIKIYGLMYDVSTGLLREVDIPFDHHEDDYHVEDNSEDGH